MNRLRQTNRNVGQRLGGLVACLVATVVATAWSSLAFGQGCAMCYNNAAASGAHTIQALKSGILVLLVPPVLMFIAIFVRLFRSKERVAEEFAVQPVERTPDIWL